MPSSFSPWFWLCWDILPSLKWSRMRWIWGKFCAMMIRTKGTSEFQVYYPNPHPRFCSLYRGTGTTPWQSPAYKENLTETLLDEFKQFVTDSENDPWFFYFATPQVHSASYFAPMFKGSTTRGSIPIDFYCIFFLPRSLFLLYVDFTLQVTTAIV